MGLAIVTGGAGAIGRACARALVEDGWRVALADIDLAEAEAVAHGIGPGAVAAYRLDVTEFDAVHAVAGRIAADHGPVTGLVTAAGGGRNLDLTFGPFIETGPEEWDRNIEVHLNGVYHTCHAVLPLIIAAGGGAIVNTASGAGIRGGPPHLRQRFASARQRPRLALGPVRARRRHGQRGGLPDVGPRGLHHRRLSRRHRRHPPALKDRAHGHRIDHRRRQPDGRGNCPGARPGRLGHGAHRHRREGR
jgi:NAD(P)-dependent dehydrogenase (short-subunit alcohol dehydrogenase family)